ncbi:MAG: hypothetical protein ACQETE_02760 [Bacteroidota bacterium]
MNMKKIVSLVGFVFWASTAWAQIQIYHDKPAVLEQGDEATFEFRVPGLNVSSVQEAIFYYRSSGSSVYRQMEMKWSGSAYTASLDITEEMNGALQYYAAIYDVNQVTWTYPSQEPEQNPTEVEVVNQEEDTSEPVAMDGSSGEVEYTILSPRPGETVGKDELLVAVSLFYENEALVDADQLQLMLNGNDVTEQATVNDFFVSFVPEEAQPGDYSIELINRTQGENQTLVSWDFSVAEQQQLASLVGEEQRLIQGQAQLTARNQMVGGDINNMYRGSFRVSGEQGLFRYNLNGLYTSQADPRLQPQHRYGGDIYLGKWFELHAGHTYPTLNPLMLAGRRMYGVNSALHLANENINLQFLYGTLSRKISNLYTPVTSQIDTVATFDNGNVVTDTSFAYGFEDNGRGTYERDIIGGRLSFGRSDKFQWGVNLLKVQDDTTSITTVNGYQEMLRKADYLVDDLSEDQRKQLAENPDELSFSGSNPKPKGNFVAGTDMAINADQGNIQFHAQAGVSLLNENIAPGVLDQQAAEDLGFDLDNDILSLIDQLSLLFIMNENITTVPVKLSTDDNGDLQTEVFVPKGIFAGQSRLNLNYLNNNLSVRYQWVGPDYTSLANSTIINDIAGFNITDRINLLNNRLYLTLGYEDTHNNLLGSQDATINTTGYRGNLSWYPVKRTLPRVSVGYTLRERTNGIAQTNPFLSNDLVNRSVRNVVVENGETIAQASARFTETNSITASISQQFTFLNLRHDASLSFSNRATEDKYFAYGGSESQTYSLNLTSQFLDTPLRTRIGLNYNTTDALGGLSNIEIQGLTAGATYYMLDDKLSLSGNVAITNNLRSSTNLAINDNGTIDEFLDDFYEPDPDTQSEEESRSYIFNATVQYDISDSHILMLDANLNNVVSTAQAYNIPNDRIIEARYVFRF